MVDFDSLKKRITVLFGAGVNLDFFPELSTIGITETIMSNKNPNMYPFDTGEIVELLKTVRSIIGKERGIDYNDVDFEDLYQYINDVYTETSPEVNKIPHYKIPEELEKEDPTLFFKALIYILNEIQHLLFCLRPQIWLMEINGKKINELQKRFFDNLGKQYHVDLFTLNYDAFYDYAIDEYNDGFYQSEYDGYRYFIPKKALSNDTNKINHLHGSIMFTTQSPLETVYGPIYKTNPPNEKMPIDNQMVLQNEDLRLHSTIITGKDKLNGKLHDPFRTYHTNFDIALKNNDKLLVIGYGYGDTYINSIIDSFLQKGGLLIDISPRKNKWLNDVASTHEYPLKIVHIDSTMKNVLEGMCDEQLSQLIKREFVH